MSAYLPARTGSAYPARSDRKLSRDRDRLSLATSMEVAHMRACKEIESARVQAIGSVAAVALMETSNLSAAEAVLAQRTPHAAGRLRFVADSGATAMAEVVMQMNRRLR